MKVPFALKELFDFSRFIRVPEEWEVVVACVQCPAADGEQNQARHKEHHPRACVHETGVKKQRAKLFIAVAGDRTVRGSHELRQAADELNPARLKRANIAAFSRAHLPACHAPRQPLQRRDAACIR